MVLVNFQNVLPMRELTKGERTQGSQKTKKSICFFYFFLCFYVFSKTEASPKNKKGLGFRVPLKALVVFVGVFFFARKHLFEFSYSKENKKKNPSNADLISLSWGARMWNVFRFRCGMWVGRMWNGFRFLCGMLVYCPVLIFLGFRV